MASALSSTDTITCSSSKTWTALFINSYRNPDIHDLAIRSATEYGYLSGEMQSSSGHVRVRVDGNRQRLTTSAHIYRDSEGPGRTNGEVSYSYQLTPERKR